MVLTRVLFLVWGSNFILFDRMYWFLILNCLISVLGASRYDPEASFNHELYDNCMNQSLDPYLSMIPCEPNSFRFYRNVIGKGTFGKVTVGREKATNLKYVKKSIKNTPGYRIVAQREVCSLMALSHRAVPKLKCVHVTEAKIYIMMDFIEGHDLETMIANGMKKRPSKMALVARQIGDILEFLEKEGILHRDVKPANIIYTPDNSVKLVDFGFATKRRSETRCVFTATYAAPEVLKCMLSDCKANYCCEQFKCSDRYSLGMTLLSIYLGKQWPWKSTTAYHAIFECSEGIPQGKLDKLKHHQELFKGLLNCNPSARWSFEQLWDYLNEWESRVRPPTVQELHVVNSN